MLPNESLSALLATTLALAYAAVSNPTDEQVSGARNYADEALPQIARLCRFNLTLSEARQIAVLLHELQEVLTAAERRHAFARAG